MTPYDPDVSRRISARGRGEAGFRPDRDPLVAAVHRIGDFVGHGWNFTTRLAEQLPQAYLSGWSL
ncbi:hypothetical protein [Nocardia brevicatena]|uniref:hypothetical protein n=1 Tax=Nocardia brevicatena TaxID=37327 RepID=UPI0002D6CB39|nr:hypothetical protein [Nocardia brevicatena]